MWAICKSKQAKLYLRYIYKNVPYSFSRIPLTDEEVAKTLAWAEFKPSKFANTGDSQVLEWTLDKQDEPVKYTKLLKRINQLAKQHSSDTDFETAPSKIYESKLEGTSRLVRSKDYSRIHIAKRKNNRVSINSVCIPNDVREDFFEDSRKHNGRPENNMYCVYKDNGYVFDYWSNLMDEYYKGGLK